MMGIYIEKLKKMTKVELSNIAKICGAQLISTTKWFSKANFPNKIELRASTSIYDTNNNFVSSNEEKYFFRDFSLNIVANGSFKIDEKEKAKRNVKYIKLMYNLMKKYDLNEKYKEDYINFYKNRINKKQENLQKKSEEQLNEINMNVEVMVK